MNRISFEFNVTGNPSIIILVDNTVIEKHKFNLSHEIVDINIDLPQGKHQLVIDSVIDNQCIELLNIYVDQIRLPSSFIWDGDFHFLDQVHRSSTRWECSGQWKWNFETPVVDWVLLNKLIKNGVDITKYLQDRQDYINSIDRVLEKIKNLRKKYNV